MENTEHVQPAPPPVGQGTVRIGVAGLMVLLVVLFVLGWLPRARNQQHLAAMAQEVHDRAPHVTVVFPHPGEEESITLPGSILAVEETTLQARTGGYLRRRYVDIGSRVKAGQLLAEIESPEVDQQVMQAEADTAKSRATVGQASADVARLQAGVVQAQSETAKQRAAVKQARAQMTGTESKRAQAEAAVAQAEASLERAKQAMGVQQAGLAQAQAQQNLARTTSHRYDELEKQGFVAQQDADEKRAALLTANAAVQSVQASIQASQAEIDAARQAVRAYEALVKSAEADVQAGRENVRAAQAALQSTEATVQAARAGVEASRANVQANRAAVGSSQANARRYAVLRSFERIVAPFDGVITSRNVDTGALIGAPGADTTGSTTPRNGLFGLARTDTLRILVNVPQSFAPAVRQGARAVVLLHEYPGRKFVGAIARFSGALDAGSRTLLTEIRLDNRDNALRPGMYAQVQMIPQNRNRLPRVAANTLVFGAAGTRVAVVTHEGRVHYQSVRIARDFGKEIEIAEGLKGDEKLITDPTDDIKEGTSVQIVTH